MASAVETFNTAFNSFKRIELLNNMINSLSVELILKLFSDWNAKFGKTAAANENSAQVRKAVKEVWDTHAKRGCIDTFMFKGLLTSLAKQLPADRYADTCRTGLLENLDNAFTNSVITLLTMTLGPIFRRTREDAETSSMKTHVLSEVASSIEDAGKEAEKVVERINIFFGMRTYSEEEFTTLLGKTLDSLNSLYGILFILQSKMLSPSSFSILMGNLPREMRFDLFLTGRMDAEKQEKVIKEIKDNKDLFKGTKEALHKATSMEEMCKILDNDETLLPAALKEIKDLFDVSTPIAAALVWTGVNGIVADRQKHFILEEEKKKAEAKNEPAPAAGDKPAEASAANSGQAGGN